MANLLQYKLAHFGKYFETEPARFGHADSDSKPPKKNQIEDRTMAIDRVYDDYQVLCLRNPMYFAEAHKIVLMELRRRTFLSRPSKAIAKTYLQVQFFDETQNKYNKIWIDEKWVEPFRTEAQVKSIVLKSLQDKWKKGKSKCI